MLVALGGCGPSVLSPEPPRPHDPAPAARNKAASALPPPFTTSWMVALEGVEPRIAIAPSGDVVSYDVTGRFTVYARDTGEVLEVGSAPEASSFGFVDDGLGILASGDALAELRFPGLSPGRSLSLGGDAGRMAIGATRVAVALPREVVVIDRGAWKEIDRFPVGAPVSAIALTPDEHAVVVGEELDGDGKAAIELRDLRARATRTIVGGVGQRVGPIAISPDGTELFARVEERLARIYSLRAGEDAPSPRERPLAGWITDARYLTSTVLATIGENGLVLLDLDGSRYALGATVRSEELSVSADRSVLCVRREDRKLVCYASRPLAPSAYKAPPREETRAAAPALEGRLLSRKGDTLVLELRDAAGLEGKPASGTLYHRIDTQIGLGGGQLSFHGWLGVAAVTITSRSANKLTLKITRKLTVVKIDDVETDDIHVGDEVKLELGAGAEGKR
jgi:hypothetical protein